MKSNGFRYDRCDRDPSGEQLLLTLRRPRSIERHDEFPIRFPKSRVDLHPRVSAQQLLVCEDGGLTALRLKKALTSLGYPVVGEAKNREEAVRLARELRPSVILMDVNMPRLDGIRALERIMRECPTPVVMLTAYNEQELVQRAVEAGAAGYLVKPVVNEQLRPAISLAMTRFAQLQQERTVASSLAEQFASHAPAVAGFQVAARFEPVSSVDRVGGDFFDFIELDENRTGVVTCRHASG